MMLSLRKNDFVHLNMWRAKFEMVITGKVYSMKCWLFIRLSWKVFTAYASDFVNLIFNADSEYENLKA